MTFRKHILLVKVWMLPLAALAVLRVQAQIPNMPTPAQTTVPAPLVAAPATLSGYNVTGTINYVRTREAVAPITDPVDFDNQDYHRVKQTTQYVDGLGRPLQTVMRQASPGSSPRDMVAPVVYDEFGREVHKYLPYVQSQGYTNDGSFKTNPFADQDHFYKTVYKDASQNLMYAGEQYLFGKTVFEPSPLNRPVTTLAPGNSWVGSNNGVVQKYLINTAADGVRIWDISSNIVGCNAATQGATVNIPTSAGAYAAGKLYKNITLDEHSNAVVEYKDMEGRVVLKKVQIAGISADYSGYDGWLCTYYVYDDLGQLRFVLPPNAVEAIIADWTIIGKDDVINELCFRYEYDLQQRMIAKKVPGAGWVYLVYDRRDRLVFTQDANMRLKDQWMTTLYDGLNRPVMTGMIVWNTCRDALQTYLNGLTSFGGSTAPEPGPGSSGGGAQMTFSVRDNSRTLYQATESIVFEDGFESEAGAEFTAEIVNGGNGATNNSSVGVSMNPVPTDRVFTALTITHYDDYLDAPAQFMDAYNSKLTVEDGNSTIYPDGVYPEPLLTNAEQQSVKTQGLVTWVKVRVLEDPNNLDAGAWLSTTSFYDSKGRVIQARSNNYKGGSDVATSRYDFTGKALCSYQMQENPQAVGDKVIKIKTLMSYDHGGRLLKVWKTVNDEDSKTTLISSNKYDELGQLKTKQLGQKRDEQTGNYTGLPVETLDYAYNIRGWLKGINAAYSHPELTSGVPPDRWFGMELYYDWGSYQGMNQFNGNISLVTWRSKGSDWKRAYGYSYDRANRLLGADYIDAEYDTDYSGNPFSSRYDVYLGDGVNTQTAYDANGNIRAMTQWGVTGNIIGQNFYGQSRIIDVLEYSYFPNSNKLSFVRDQSGFGTQYKLGDFTDDGSTSNDYGYDRNGNLISDKNKYINGAQGLDVESGGAIVYNHLNLPYKIMVKSDDGNLDKGTITYIYDAEGNKLEKRVHENASGANPAKDVSTCYLSGTVYEQDVLQFVPNEGGRFRINTESTVKAYNYDYFIKDHLGNIRVVLTDEMHPVNTYQATMEDNRRPTELAQFGDKITSTETLKSDHPGFDQDNNNTKISVVNGNSEQSSIGPGIVLKVMAGDRVKISSQVWYQSGGDASVNSNLQPSAAMISQFIDGITKAGKAGASLLTSSVDLYYSFVSLLSNQINNDQSKPSAFLNWMVLEEEKFKTVGFNYSGEPIPTIQANQQKVAMFANNGNEIVIRRNGYLYVFVSNKSRQNVYFDDIRIDHTPGPLLEETHYYPFGLTMAGISSKAAGGMENRCKFNGIEHTTDLDLNHYDAFYRTLDPQIGRFLQIDPKIESAEAWSPYSAMLNNPIRYADPLGDSTIPGGGFWRNALEGFKDGGKSTLNFVKSLGTSEGWQNLGNGLADLGTRANPASAVGVAENIVTAHNVAEGVKNIPNMTKDELGHAVGYGIEKVAEAVVLSKGAGAASNVVSKALGAGVEIPVSPMMRVGPSANVQKVLNTLEDIKAEGGTVKMNPLNSTQELNMTIKHGGSKLDLRVESHPLPAKYGGDGVNPTRHMNVDIKPKANLPLQGHVKLD